MAFYMDQCNNNGNILDYSPFFEVENNKYQKGFFAPDDVVLLSYDG